jgi:uncharacterized protein YecE (DUF72 family)
MATIRIGISGWRYRPWRGVFYPEGLPQRCELDYAARRFDSIEINGSFYSLQRPESYSAWRDATPDGFEFALKGPRFITHMLRLRDCGKALANFLASGPLRLGDRLGPILWQLPPNLRFDAQVLDAFLSLLPRDTGQALALARRRDVARMRGRSALAIDAVRPLRHALEPRHESFGGRDALALLRRHGVALVAADTAGKFPYFDEATAGFSYVRLHGGTQLYVSSYSKRELATWARRIRGWARHGDVYCYFDNDAKVHAPFDALALMEKLGPT